MGQIFDPHVLERAFGPSGEPGDPGLIRGVADGVIQIYEGMLDWAAALRNVSIAEEFEELVEVDARMVDGPAMQIREFVFGVADQISKIPLLLLQAKDEGATKEEPKTLTLTLRLAMSESVEKEHEEAIERLRRRREG